jgi:protein TonB
MAEGKDTLYLSMPRHHDQRLLMRALAGAILIHLAAMFITLPQVKEVPTEPKVHHVIAVRKYIPPPPPIERRHVARGVKAKTKTTRILPIPDPTPEDLEPIREPQPELYAGDPLAPEDVEFLIGEADGPPAGSGYASPGLAGVGGITVPELIKKIRPEYPELARKARLESRVFLKAVILDDGTVGEIEIVGCNCPCMGFEEAAIAAVRQWRYEPATLDGRPVDVYFTVIVEFTIE